MSAPSAHAGDATAPPAAAAPSAAAPTATHTLPKGMEEDLDFLVQAHAVDMEPVEEFLASSWLDSRRGPGYVSKLIWYLRDRLAPDAYEHIRGWQRARIDAAARDSPASSPPGSPPAPAPPAKPSSPVKHSDTRRVDARTLRTALGLADKEFITGPIPTDFRTQWRVIQNLVEAREYTPPQAWEVCGLVYNGGAYAALEKAVCHHYALASPADIIPFLRRATTTFDWAPLEELLVDYFNGPNFVYSLVTQLLRPGPTPTATLDAFERNRRAILQFTVGHEASRYRDAEDRLAAALNSNVGELYALAQTLNRQRCDAVTTCETILTVLMLETLPEEVRRRYFTDTALSLESIPQRHDRWEKLYDPDHAVARVRRDHMTVPTPVPVQLPDPESVPAMAAGNRPSRSAPRPARYNDEAPLATGSSRRRPGRNAAPAPPARHTKQNGGRSDHPGSAKPGGRRQPK